MPKVFLAYAVVQFGSAILGYAANPTSVWWALASMCMLVALMAAVVEHGLKKATEQDADQS